MPTSESDLHVVVTRVTPVRENGRIIVHAYGPYHRTKAKRVQSELKHHAILYGYAHRAEVSCCKLIDVDRLNREAQAREEARDDTVGRPDLTRGEL